MSLEIKDVDAHYGSTKILDSINFSASHGELMGIIGPNGSGKTTLLRTISRILKPKVGTILLEGRDVQGMKDKEFSRNFAAVPQDTTINFDFSALDIVLIGRNPHLGRLELETEKDIEIARRSMELKIMELLKRLTTEEKLIVIAVIHDLNLPPRYCDRLVLLHEGKIITLGKQTQVLTAENIKNTFGAAVIVKKHALTNQCYVSPVPSPLKHENKTEAGHVTIHLICGGGEGASLMHELSEKGYKVTAGVVNMLDTDCEVAKLLNIPVVTEAPFSPITQEAFQAHLALVDKANVVVLCNIPFGFGNLKNLEVAETALKRKKALLVFDTTNIKKRDFTNGEAAKRFIALKTKGALTVKNEEEVLKAIKEDNKR
jgi:iron complex transport system ATP-binding protein